MPLTMVRSFVQESISRQKRWKRIRVLGGEPTLHPEFLQVIEELLEYRHFEPSCIIEVVSNGHGTAVQKMLSQLPPEIWIENSNKEGNAQSYFGPFNLAPIDDPAYAHADYRNGCAIMRDCGMGLTPLGYYPCAVAGGIERITGGNTGQGHLPDDSDDMMDQLDRCCRLCGRFRDGHYVPWNIRSPLRGNPMSPSWKALYTRWHEQARRANL